MSKAIIYHGSEKIVRRPELKVGKIYNDYGQGFYCTQDLELAKEWACKNDTDGFTNAYEFDLSDLKVLNLNSDEYTVLNWIAVLLKNRVFSLDNHIANVARNYIIEHFCVAVEDYDVVIGYRADDSYFSFANAFVNNSLSLRSLYKALRLGQLGQQIVLVSEIAFEKLSFLEAVPVDGSIYYPKFYARDLNARKAYRDAIYGEENIMNEIYVLDIIRQEMKNDDPRIQRIILE